MPPQGFLLYFCLKNRPIFTDGADIENNVNLIYNRSAVARIRTSLFTIAVFPGGPHCRRLIRLRCLEDVLRTWLRLRMYGFRWGSLENINRNIYVSFFLPRVCQKETKNSKEGYLFFFEPVVAFFFFEEPEPHPAISNTSFLSAN